MIGKNLVLSLFVGGLLFGPPLFGNPAKDTQPYQVENLFSGSEIIWGFDFLSEKEIIFTEKSGKMKILNLETKAVRVLSGVPTVWDKGQGGLLDVKVHPQDRSIYWTFSEEQKGKGAGTVLARATLEQNQLKGLRRIFVSKAVNTSRIHFGSRILFQSPYVFVTLGDRDDRHKSQSLGDHNGKIIRLFEDGKVPTDNPFVGKAGALPEIWSYGHRNPQGISLNPVTKEIWAGEFGPRGGDEINLIKKGANYGWPVVTYGREYYGPSIGEGTSKAGMEAPLVHWVPSVSFSGMAFYDGKAFPQWKNNLFLACLATQHVRRIAVDGTQATQQEELLKNMYVRFRHVAQGPDGFLYFATDAGSLGRLKPR